MPKDLWQRARDKDIAKRSMGESPDAAFRITTRRKKRKKKKNKKVRTWSPMEVCPVCKCPIRSGRLERHKRKVHGAIVDIARKNAEAGLRRAIIAAHAHDINIAAVLKGITPEASKLSKTPAQAALIALDLKIIKGLKAN